MFLNDKLKNVDEAKVREVLEQNNISRRDFLKAAAIASGAGVAGRTKNAYADIFPGQFIDDFEDGVLDPEWTPIGDVTETGGNLELAVDGTVTTSYARTNAYDDADQVMTAVFDGSVALPNVSAYYVQIGDEAGTDFFRVYVRRSGFGQFNYSIADEGGILNTINGTEGLGIYTLEIRKTVNSAIGWVNGAQIGGAIAIPQIASGSLGATNFGSGASYTAKVQSAELQSASIQPFVQTPVAGPIGLAIGAGSILAYGSYLLRQRKSEK